MTSRRNFVKTLTLGSTVHLLPSFRIMHRHDPDAEPISDLRISLSGDWHFRLDPKNEGIQQAWYKARFIDNIKLPGSMQGQGYGNKVNPETLWWDGKLKGEWASSPVYAKYRQPDNFKNYEFLQPKRHYLGIAWYAKGFIIPKNWKNKRVTLILERVHWKSTVYVNGAVVGTQKYLGTVQEYDVTNFLVEGENRLTISVDNSRMINVGDMPHSISEQTQGTWNGIVGKIALHATDKVWIDDVQVYPDVSNKKVWINLDFGNLTATSIPVALEISVRNRKQGLPAFKKNIIVQKDKSSHQLSYTIGEDLQLWNEHHPSLYVLSAQISATTDAEKYTHSVSTTFGMREVGIRGSQVTINSVPVHFRGNVDCAIFPVNGYPNTNVDWWKKLWLLYKEWGLNMVRFHSWCPPVAAFIAADEIGIYLQPECSEWENQHTEVQFHFLMEESKAILKRYGNHPSFVFMALGNEKSIKKEYLEDLFTEWKKDKRRLYTGKSGGGPLLGMADFYVGAASKKGNRARYYLGWPPKPGPSYFYKFQPATTRDYTAAVEDDQRPFFSHEIAQRCAYPDVKNLQRKFTGLFQPTYLEIAEDQLRERGMLGLVDDFVNASGKWQVEMCKEEIEANLRTPKIAGFHLLSLQDFPGQGTAPVGFLDFFYDEKPYVEATTMRKFCHHTVVLAKMQKRTWFNQEIFQADILLYNHSGKILQPIRTTVTIKSGDGDTLAQKEFTTHAYTDGALHHIGNFLASLSLLPSPAKYILEVKMDDILNDWDFWVYPQVLPLTTTTGIVISDTLTEAVKLALDEGKTVLLLPKQDDLKGKLVQCFGTFYWTAFDFHGGETSACGLLTNPNHPVFKHFPTDFHGNWQWWELLTKAAPMILDDFESESPWPKDYRPLIHMIPSWKVNRKLSVLSEAKVGKGKLMLCSMDITTDLEHRKVAAQFRYSLIKYMRSEDFNPQTEVKHEVIQALFC